MKGYKIIYKTDGHEQEYISGAIDENAAKQELRTRLPKNIIEFSIISIQEIEVKRKGSQRKSDHYDKDVLEMFKKMFGI